MISKNGFTLAEILVVIAIVAIAGVMLVAIFTNTLRGSNKSQILASIKQNGQIVLDSMDRIIRDADNVVCISNDKNTLVVIKNGAYTRFRLFPATAADNGSIQQDFPIQPEEDAKSVITVFLATVCTDPMGTDSPPPQILTDTNPQSGVSVQNISPDGLFAINKRAGAKDSVTIKFKLGSAVGLPAAISSQIDPVEFQTTIELR